MPANGLCLGGGLPNLFSAGCCVGSGTPDAAPGAPRGTTLSHPLLPLREGISSCDCDRPYSGKPLLASSRSLTLLRCPETSRGKHARSQIYPRSERGLQLACDITKSGTEVGADQGERGDGGDRNQRRDQRILNRGDTATVLGEADESCTLRSNRICPAPEGQLGAPVDDGFDPNMERKNCKFIKSLVSPD